MDSAALHPWVIFFGNKDVWLHHLLELWHLGCNELQLGKIMGEIFSVMIIWFHLFRKKPDCAQLNVHIEHAYALTLGS